MLSLVKRVVTGIASLVLAAGCGRGLADRYPSYELAIAKVRGLPHSLAIRVEDDNVPMDPWCNCPRVFYHGTWVYYYSGRWIYWADDWWYTYPSLRVYYHAGVPFVYDGPTRSIRKGEPRVQNSRPRDVRRGSEEPPDFRLQTRPVQPRRDPPPPPIRPVEVRPMPKKDR